MALVFRPPYTPFDPANWVRAIYGYEHNSPVFLIERPNFMDRLLPKSLPIDQATGIGFVVRIVFNDLTIENTDIDFIIR